MGRRRRETPRGSAGPRPEGVVAHAPDAEPPPAGEAAVAVYPSWSDDDVRRAARSRRFAWALAWMAVGCAVLSLAAIAALAPWQRAVPIIVRVHASGLVDVVTELEAVRLPDSEAMDRFFIARYVRLREQRIGGTGDEQAARIVGWMTAGRERDRFSSALKARKDDDPRSEIDVSAITFVARQGGEDGTANVRFARRLEAGVQESWVATLDYAYHATAAMRMEARMENPLGFGVTSYSAAREVLAP